MSGHIAGRKRKWPWAGLSVLFAVTLILSLAVASGGVRIILAIVAAVGLCLCLLGLVLVSVSSARLRRAQDDGAKGDEAAETEAEGQPSDRPRTYEEVFGPQTDLDAEDLPPAPEGEEWPGDERAEEIEAEAQPTAEQPTDDDQAAPAEDDVQAPHADADVNEEVDQVDPHDADEGSQDHLERLREEFRARAEEAALRVKQREAELQEAASVADQER